MGAYLIRSSAFVSSIIDQLEESLATLPVEDRPPWSLRAEMLAGADTSRIAEAALSQPLCTAVQVALLALLSAAGIKFTAVVGHSSGEIAAAYAAGFLSASDSIRIAYYRGLFAKFAGNESNGQKGSMLAAGAGWEDAAELVNSPQFKGRLAIAAHNSPASVTLSGDADAVAEAKEKFDKEKKFARALKVDTAYHSHHMLPCGDRYVAALNACGVKVIKDRADTSTSWYSSVSGSPKAMEAVDDLQAEYWRDNMTNAVLFCDAVKNAVSQSEQLDLAIEVGPHPALKGPATQNVSEVQQNSLPYTGLLSRGKNDVEAFSEALGFVYTRLPQLVSLTDFEKATADPSWEPKLLRGLPSYQWSHGRVHWAESRISKRMRTRKQPFHEVLGFLQPDSNAHDMRWLNVLKQKEIPWLKGHQLQGQTVFPAAGYVAMALEASKVLSAEKSVRLVELHDLSIPRAITLEESDESGVETLVTLTGIEYHGEEAIVGSFACYSVPVVGSGSDSDMELSASGTLKIVLGNPDVATLPSQPLPDFNMVPVDADYFYQTIAELGYNYSGSFRTLSEPKRKLDYSSGLVDTYEYDDNATSEYMVHPSMLDVAFQASFLAYSCPGDGRLWSLSVPTSIGAIRVNPEVCSALPTSTTKVPVYTTIDNQSEAISTSIDIFGEDGENGMIQVEDLVMKPFAPATAADDRVMFTTTKFGLAVPDGAAIVDGVRPSSSEAELASALERIAYYHLRKLKEEFTKDQTLGEGYWKRLLAWIDQTLPAAASGRHSILKKDWANDSAEDIKALTAQFSDSIDVKLLQAVDEHILDAVRSNADLGDKIPADLLNEWHSKGLGFETYNALLAKLVDQIADRYPHARILEIGAATGGAAKPILKTLGQKFSSYTYTDKTDATFAQATQDFKAYSEKMAFKVLDLQEEPSEQGFQAGSFDIIVASHSLAESGPIKTSLENIRQLLRPGGYLVLAEVTNADSARFHNILSAVPGWWYGSKDGTKGSPLLTSGTWHSALRKAGFGGVDARTPEIGGTAWPLTVIAAQAVDERVQFLRRPLSAPSPSTTEPFYIESLVILGNDGVETARISEEVSSMLDRFCGNVTVLSGLPTEDDLVSLPPMSTFLNLVDLESPIFKDATDEKINGIKLMLELAKSIVWVTCGGHIDQPYQMASISFGRTIRMESAHINYSHIDISGFDHNISQAIAEYLVQQTVLEDWSAPPSALADATHTSFDLLWSKEPEVFLNKGKLTVPRLVQQTAQNARLNSSRREITKPLAISATNVELLSHPEEKKYSIIEQAVRSRKQSAEGSLKVQGSSLKALQVAADTFLFLSAGKQQNSGLKVALSTANSAEITPIIAADVPEASASDVGSLLVAVASELLAGSLARTLTKGHHLLVHCSGKDHLFAKALSSQAAAHSFKVTFICESGEGQKDSSWIQLNARVSDLAVRKAIRGIKPTHFIDMKASSFDSLGSRIARALPPTSESISQATLWRTEVPSLSPPYNLDVLQAQLKDAVSKVVKSDSEVLDAIVPLSAIHSISEEYATTAITWPSDTPVDANVRPLNAQKLFSKDKTYLLVGLSGQIGQSLCEWMVTNGAGCVVLTSRNPKVDERWLASVQTLDSEVKTMSMDVLDPASIKRVVDQLNSTSRPIGGVANGAVIFDDQLFNNMSGETMRRVLGPKVDGSRYLDEVFHDVDLDFFILFSSVVCIYGNAGQANYSAANGFMNALVQQRRARGLPASSIALGMVAGIGYAQSAGQAVQEQLVKKVGLPPVSETDLRQIFAEAILAGSQPTEDAVVIAGLRSYGDDEDLRGPWFSNPYFSHMVYETSSSAAADGDKKASLPVGQQLAGTTSEAEALQVLQDCFAARLRVVLQLGDQEIDYEAPLLELGIDSLVAVEVRSWFLKELKVDIPVLKIVSGVTLIELSEQALKKLPEGSYGKGSGGDAPAAKAEPAKAKAEAPKTEPKKAKDSGAQSSSSSSSGEDKRSATTATTPSDGNSVADQKQTPPQSKPARVDRTPKKFLKSEKISLPQSRFWFLRHLLQDPTTPNVVIAYRLTGNLRIGDLERAVRVVTNRHEALRTCFIEDEHNAGEAYQSILASSPLRVERKKIASDDEVTVEYEKLRSHVFDLEHGDVMKLVLLSQSSTNHTLLINYHHIVMDGGSWNVFFSDLEKAYVGQSLGPAPRQYPEFSASQRRAIDNGEMEKELKYWQSVFPPDSPPPILPLLPMSRTSSRVAMKGFDTHQVSRHLEGDLIGRIRAVSKAAGSSPFHFHLAAFKAMLFSFADEETQDLCIGFADAARSDASVERSIGFFLNLLTLRFSRQPDQKFSDAIVEARKTAHAALECSQLPFDVLLSRLNVARSSLHAPFFQAFLDYRQGVKEKHPWGNCEAELGEVKPGRTAYDITLDVTDSSATEAHVVFRVQKSLYDLTAANFLLDTYINVLDAVTKDASVALKDTPLFTEKQLTEAVHVGRGKFQAQHLHLHGHMLTINAGRNLQTDWPESLAARIDEIAKKNPDSVALMDGFDKVLTYTEMTNRIEAISETLQNVGVVEGSRVLVYQQPAADWPCSMLAIMRLNAIYVPLNLREPVSRLATVAKDCEPTAVLADFSTIEEAPQLEVPNAHLINVSDLPVSASRHIPVSAKKLSPAAILYTSGSTGTPKGITVTHQGLRNEIEGYTKEWGLGAERVLQQSAFTFNHSSDQMYTGLVNGGMVYVVPAEKRGDPLSITEIMRDVGITYTKATPSEYSMWIQFGANNLRDAQNWRFAFGGGETLTTTVTDEIASLNLPNLHFFNSYGPTEISISSHKMAIDYRDRETLVNMSRIPCGYSLPNYYTYVLDDKQKPVPVGMPGEIYLAGCGVSLGYLKNTELTNKHFFDNPYVTEEDVQRGWTRMYRTGDIGHLEPDGAFVFHSRISGDSQVKIRGLRIELSDIESNIVVTSEGQVREAVVTLREGDPAFLVAHVVFAHNTKVIEKETYLQNLLRRLPLPQYMIPVIAIPLDSFPLNNHSKVNRKAVQALPLPTMAAGSGAGMEMTPTMKKLANVWRDVLGDNLDKFTDGVDPLTNFFLVGGNSLLVIRLQARIMEVFHAVIPLFKLMGSSTLGEMARAIDESTSIDRLDWNKETAPPSIPEFLNNIPTKSSTGKKTVLVTGATSFLGKYVLPALAARSDIDKIHCVAVRDQPRERAIFTASNISYHVGDLAQPMLGLGVDEFRGLSSEVDAILHMGAGRSFWDNYHVLRPVNVDSIKEIVKLAAPRKVPIHFVSTVGVLPRDGNVTAANAGSAASHPPSNEGSDGYVASKWAGERVLERSAEELGVPTHIYRFVPTEKEDATIKQELMDSFIHMVDSLNTTPDMGVWNGRVDLTPGDVAGQWFSKSVAEPVEPGTAQFTHLGSLVTFHTDELAKHIQEQRGDRTDLTPMPFLRWLGRCKAIGFKYIISSQQATVGGDGDDEHALVSWR